MSLGLEHLASTEAVELALLRLPDEQWARVEALTGTQDQSLSGDPWFDAWVRDNLK